MSEVIKTRKLLAEIHCRIGHRNCEDVRQPAAHELSHGPAGRLLKLLDRHQFRPAHIHSIENPVSITAPGYAPLETQLFDRGHKHLADDAVFTVKQSLIVDFVPKRYIARAV
ncbi:MAG: hypothetical protein M1829_000987 [Trizodia sp. TS-e1964]|nr:MAG: hypothetical protein M1829_000987 [Trizodia sp. TS-e1964]